MNAMDAIRRPTDNKHWARGSQSRLVTSYASVGAAGGILLATILAFLAPSIFITSAIIAASVPAVGALVGAVIVGWVAAVSARKSHVVSTAAE